MKAALFVPCYVDAFFPEVGIATLELLERLSKFSDAIRRHGGDFEAYLGERDVKSGAFPTFLVKVREGMR